jgi:hypothetical protein
VALFVKSRQTNESPQTDVRFRHFWGTTKRQDLVDTLKSKNFSASYTRVNPERVNRYSFRPVATNASYQTWPLVAELSAIEPMLGLNDNRGQALSDISRQALAARMKKYFTSSVPFEELTQLHKGLTSNAASFNATETRERLLRDSAFNEENIRRFWFKPFDLRWAYIERYSNLWNRVRPELLAQAARENQFLLVRRHAPKFPDGATVYFSRHLSDQHALHTDAYFIPFEIDTFQSPQKDSMQSQLALRPASRHSDRKSNIGMHAAGYLSEIGIRVDGPKAEDKTAIWLHALGIGHTPGYLKENADGIRQDWPRIPLPDSKKRLLDSAALGDQVASLLDTESTVKGVTAGDPRTELKDIAVTSRVGGGSLKESNLALTAGWGHEGSGGIIMPGRGKLIDREYSPAERKAILNGSRTLGLSETVAFACLGENTCDVYLNNIAFWSNIPSRVWDYTIGGYQVIKKWLSYREQPLLGRPLSRDEVRYVQEMARRIAAILLLEPALDANYEVVKQNTYPWPRKEG